MGRTTLSPDAAQDADLLFNSLVHASILAFRQAEHYDDFAVSAVLPAWDGMGFFKILSGANYKPKKYIKGDSIDVRVCAESALLQHAAHKDDLSGGVIFVRGPKELREVEGNRPSESLHPCINCRPKLKRALGNELVVVTFNGENVEPREAFTITQMIDYHDKDGEYPQAPIGMSVKEFTLAALAEGAAMSRIEVDRSQRFRTLKPEERT